MKNMILKGIIYTFLLFSNLIIASEQNNIKFNLSEIFSGVGFQKITPNHNEEVEPFTGTLKLKYIDFSVPVAPNLNMEVMRSYSSDIYSTDPFPFDRHRQYSLSLEGWSFHNGYIDDNSTKDCRVNECKPIFVTGGGERILILKDKDRPGQFRTTNHWRSEGIPPKGGLILVAPNGNKHYFETKYFMDEHVRYYLTKVENVYGDYIQYHYDGPFINKITSSNPGQIINIVIKSVPTILKGYYGRHYAYGPEIVKYNDQIVAKYKHEFLDIGYSRNNYSLTNVTLANGKSWTYDYGFLYLHSKYADEDYYKNVLHTVRQPQGITKYYYLPDKSISFSRDVHSLRLAQIINQDNNGKEMGLWSLNYNSEPGDKVISIVNRDFTTIYKYFNYASGSLWMAGLPISRTTYKNNNVLAENILRKESYEWKPILHNHEEKGYKVFHTYDLKHPKYAYKYDKATYRPVLIKKTIEQDGDIYSTDLENHDEFDNPQSVIQSTSNKYAKGDRVITQDYLNLVDKNILGLPITTTIDGVVMNKNQYNETGDLIFSEEFGKKHSNIYNNGQLLSTTDGLGNSIFYNNYKLGIPQEIIHSDGTNETQQLNSQGLITSHKDARNVITKTSYDVSGRPTLQIPALGSPTVFTYPNANTVQLSHENYNETTTTNFLDLPIEKEFGSNKKILYRYDSYGRKIYESFPFTSAESGNKGNFFQYDSLSRPTSICSGEVSIKTNCIYYEYLPNNTTKITNSNGEFKEISRLSYSDPGGGDVVRVNEFDRVTSIDRDNLGFVRSVSQGAADKHVIKTYKYDDNYNLIEYFEPESGNTIYKYDILGNLLSKNNNGLITSYIYHPKNYNLLEKKYSDNSYNELYDYDANGNLVISSKGNVSLHYDYNDNNKLVEESLLVDGLNTDSRKDQSILLSVKYEYNTKGDISKIIYPDNTALNLEPDEYGQPRQLGDYVYNIDYHSNGHWKSFQSKNGINAETTLDDFNRINSYNYDTLSLKYTYDGNNNLKKLLLADHKSKDYNYNLKFSYDLAGRISTADGPWGNVKYNYDANNNIISITNKSLNSKNIHQSFLYDDKLHLQKVDDSSKTNSVSKYTYDDHGNITSDGQHKYLYGLDGNLLTLSGEHSSFFEYDTNHNRVLKQENGILEKTKTITFYSKSGKALYDVNLKTKKSNKYIYLNDHRVVKIENTLDNNAKELSSVNYYHNDSIGSPVAITDSQGEIITRELYNPFGQPIIKSLHSSNNKYSFAGKEVDNSNLSYFGSRYYSPLIGRFMSVDPEPVVPDKTYSFNRYAYANNNPYKYVDPDGRLFWLALGIGITAYDTYNAYQVGGYSSAAKHLVTTGALNVATGGAFKAVSKAVPTAKYMYYMHKVEKLDVATKRNGAVFYSGHGNRELAEQFAKFNNKTTLEMTKGGGWLDKQDLFRMKSQPNSMSMSRDQAADVWGRLSERFAEEASGTAIGFVKGARPNSIFNTVESPTLFNNSNVTNLITGGY